MRSGTVLKAGIDADPGGCRYLVQFYAFKLVRHVRATGLTATVHEAYLALVKVRSYDCSAWKGRRVARGKDEAEPPLCSASSR